MGALSARRVHPGSHSCAPGSVSLGFAWDHSGVHGGCRVHSRSRGFTRVLLGFVGFIGVRVGSLVQI